MTIPKRKGAKMKPEIKYTPDEVGAIIRGTQPEKPKKPKKPLPPIGFMEIIIAAVLMSAFFGTVCLFFGLIF